MIANDNWLRPYRRLRTISAIVMILMGVFLLYNIADLFLPVFNISWKAISDILTPGCLFLFTLIWFLGQRSELKQRIQQHQRLLADSAELLALEQPSPNAYALSLPTTISLRPKLNMTTGLLYGMLVFLTLFFASGAIYALVSFLTTPYDSYYNGANPILAATAGGLALFSGACSWFVWLGWHCWVKVTEDGLEARLNGRRMRIAWEDASFFCVDGISGPGRRRFYTLSGKQGSVMWIQLMLEKQKDPIDVHRSALPFDLYRQQCTALLQVVAGKTGLPLHDMSLPANNVVSLLERYST